MASSVVKITKTYDITWLKNGSLPPVRHQSPYTWSEPAVHNSVNRLGLLADPCFYRG